MTPGQRKVEEAMALARAGKAGDARRMLEQYLRAKPGDAMARLALACVLSGGGEEEREASLPQFEAAAMGSDDPHEIWFHHAQALTMMDRLLEACGVCERALARYRDDPMFVFLRGRAKMAAGLSGEAIGDLRHAADVLGSTDAWTAYANATLYASGVSAEAQRDAFVRLGRLIEEHAGGRARLAARVRERGAPLRLALVSQDFREHPVGWFIETLIRELDRSRVHTTCLHVAPMRDGGTERVAAAADAFEDVSALDDAALCALARSRGFDIAIDLAGHSTGSRLDAFARGLAPVQATYLGHPVTTGMAAIDARLVDSTTDPVGSEHLCVERLVRLDPVFIAFGPARDAPEVSARVRGEGEGIVFGSFNAVTKISDACVALWSRVIAATPGSRLLLKGATLLEPKLREMTRRRFAACGVDGSRVEVLGPTRSTREHVEAYARMDVALDTFPYHGTTTTCEAMWMCVPVVTLMGDRHASRVGASLLTASGLGACVAYSEDDFVRIATGLAGDLARLSAWRDSGLGAGSGGLRAMMSASSLCDARGLAERFTLAIESLCAGGVDHG